MLTAGLTFWWAEQRGTAAERSGTCQFSSFQGNFIICEWPL